MTLTTMGEQDKTYVSSEQVLPDYD